MDVVVLGSATGAGWPDAFCACSPCAARRAAGEHRAPSSALVDGVLLLGSVGGVVDAAARAGRVLTGLRLAALTVPAADDEPGLSALAAAVARVGPALQVLAPPAFSPGDVVRHDGYEVRGLRAASPADAPSLAFDVTAPDGSRLCFASRGAPVTEARAGRPGAPYDVVLLDIAALPAALADLRRAGAVGPATRVVAVGLRHDDAPAVRLRDHAAAWGVEVLDDGTLLTVPGVAAAMGAVRRCAQRSLVLGGARSGKSAEAERRLAAEPCVTYVATAPARPDDLEWERRTALHRQRRPSTWRTVETGDVAGVLRAAGAGEALLVDCLTLWLTRVLDDAGAWDADLAAADGAQVMGRVEARIDDLVAAWRETAARAVAVSNEVGSGIVPVTASGRLFRDLMGRLNARLAAASDEVLLVVAGRVVPL